jgi:hypothetical protein
VVDKNERFANSIRDIFNGNSNWSQRRVKVASLIDTSGKGEVKHVLMKEQVFNKAFCGLSTYSPYYVSDIVSRLVSKFPDLGDALLKSEIETVRTLILEKCLFTDVKVLDKFAKSGTSSEKRFAAKVCSIAALRGLTKDDDYVVRKLAFERLGPAECLDEMLTDKRADIRAMGAAAAPYGYKKIGEVIMKEIAKRPFTIMVSKVPREFLPLILANRNLKSKWVAELVQQRMDQ